MNIFVVIPTTARRLELLDRVIESYYKRNPNHNFNFVVVKNGTFPDKVYEEYEFNYSNVIKTKSYPGGNISRAVNVGFESLKDEDYTIIGEDDYIINQDSWIDVLIEAYNSVDTPGCIGTRVHGTQRRTKKLPYLNYINDKLFEVFWSDGVLLMKSSYAKKYSCDEKFIGDIDYADLCIQMIYDGYKNYYCEMNHVVHLTIPWSDKYLYSEDDVSPESARLLFYHKWKDSSNEKIRYFIELDTKIKDKE
jgi:GT2 family glycosyltransferase